jgi:hypothetical protein
MGFFAKNGAGFGQPHFFMDVQAQVNMASESRTPFPLANPARYALASHFEGKDAREFAEQNAGIGFAAGRPFAAGHGAAAEFSLPSPL